MKRHQPISPELRQWIVDTTAAGHAVPEVLRLMKQHGYQPQNSRRIVAQVLKLPLASLTVIAPDSRRPRHPSPPAVDAGDRLVHVSVTTQEPTVRVLEGLLSDEECAQLIERARPRLKRALTVATDGQAEEHAARTSAGMFFHLGESDLIARIERRLAVLLDMPVIHGEGLQVLHYLPDQQYEPHVDWFDPNLPGYQRLTEHGGQRVASVVIYLNTPDEGGGTGFPELGLAVTARTGSAVYFAYEEGDHDSLHAGLPVIRGEKWIATKWLRERPYRQPSKN